MSNATELVQKFLGKKKNSFPEKQSSSMVHSSFRSLFDVQEMSLEEKHLFSAKLGDFFSCASEKEQAILFQTTEELRSIQKQAVILVGERVYRIRQLFREKEVKSIVFSRWLELVFSSKKTAYNALNFYEFFIGLPSDEMQKKAKALPLKAAYILASRKGSMQKKCQLIESFQGEKQQQLIERIQKAFPLDDQDKRKIKVSFSSIMMEWDRILEKLSYKKEFSPEEKKCLRKKLQQLEHLVESVEKMF